MIDMNDDDDDDNDDDDRYMCGGAIISNQHILTAAHCRVVRFTDSFIVRLGVHTLEGFRGASIDRSILPEDVIGPSASVIFNDYMNIFQIWRFQERISSVMRNIRPENRRFFDLLKYSRIFKIDLFFLSFNPRCSKQRLLLLE